MKKTYLLMTVPSGHRALKKLPSSVRKHIIDAIQVLSIDPYRGEQLEGQWKFLRSLHTVFIRTHYRIVYEVDEKRKYVVIRFAASRENFYRTLRQLQMKPLS